GRDLAIKVLLHQHDTDRGLAKRFVEEAQIGSQLQHPGIAPIYEMGRLDDKRPYFTMKLVKGETFASRLQHRDPTMTGTEKESEMMSLLQTISSVCQTVGYAHSRGVIHRVLKPSNIMVGAFGEVQVMDWGLAKVLRRGGAADDHPPIAEDATPDSAALSEEIQISAAPLQTMAGSLLGTPAYMAPEQATGENATFDERADVFAIGAMLCEVLSGHPPFSNADGVTQTLIAARSGDLTAAFKALDQCDADTQLIQITKECLSPDRNHRPRTAGGVSRKLVKQFEAVQTRLRLATEEKVRADEKVRAALQRRRLWAGLTASLLAVTVVAVFAAVIFRKQQQQQVQYTADIQEKSRKLAQQNLVVQQQLQQQRLLRYVSDAQLMPNVYASAGASGTKVSDLLDPHRTASDQSDLRGFEWHYFQGLLHPDGARFIDINALAAAISDDGDLCTVSPNGIVTRYDTLTARVKESNVLRNTDSIRSLSMGPAAKYLAVEREGVLDVYETQDLERIQRIPLTPVS
ncbi:MAG: serine/threonine-protein kinase, partial [Planctomycetota bacterium]